MGYPRIQISKCIAHSAETGRHTVIGGDGLRRGVAHSRGRNLNAQKVTLAATHPKISVGILGQCVRDINGIGQPALVDPFTAIPPHGTNAVAVSDEDAIGILARLDSQIRRAVESVNGRQRWEQLVIHHAHHGFAGGNQQLIRGLARSILEVKQREALVGAVKRNHRRAIGMWIRDQLESWVGAAAVGYIDRPLIADRIQRGHYARRLR